MRHSCRYWDADCIFNIDKTLIKFQKIMPIDLIQDRYGNGELRCRL